MGKKALGAHIITLQCASSSLRVVIKDAQRLTLVNIYILNYAAHPYYHISVTVLNATSIMLHAQLCQTSIKTYSELMYRIYSGIKSLSAEKPPFDETRI